MEALKCHILEMDNLENNTLNKNTKYWCRLTTTEVFIF